MSLLFSLLLLSALVATRRLWSSGGPGLRAADLPVAAALGGALALLCLYHQAEFHLPGGLLADDFVQYCATVGALGSDLARDSPAEISRSAPAALLATVLAGPLGIIDGLLWSSVLSLAALVAVLYLWAVALHGRVAGVAAALLVIGVGPLVLASRTLTFYPVMAAATAAGAFLVTLAVLRPTLTRLAAGGAGIGLVLSVDQLGIGWGLPFLFVLLAAAAAGERRLAGFGAIVGALALSWVGARALPPPRLPVQGEMLVETLDVRLGHHLGWHLSNTGSAPQRGQATLDSPSSVAHLQRLSGWQDGHLWGHAAPWAIVRTVQRVAPLAIEGMGVADTSLSEGRSLTDLGGRVTQPWTVALPLLLVGAGLALRRRPRVAAALFVLLLPFAAWMLIARGLAIQRADAGQLAELRALAPVLGLADTDGVLLIVKPKFFMPAVVPLPLLAGLAVGWLAEGGVARPQTWSWRALLRPAAVAGLLLAALLGAVPNLLSPLATWRWIHPSETEQLQRTLAALEEGLPERPTDDPGHISEAACARRLAQEDDPRSAQALGFIRPRGSR